MAAWTDSDLDRFAARYNVGWIACWTAASAERFRRYPRARELAEMKDGGPGSLFALDRKPSYFLKGKGRVVQADWERIALAELEPEDGEVVLSFHFQADWRVGPGFVKADKDQDPFDPIPMVRLKLPGRVERLTLTWENP